MELKVIKTRAQYHRYLEEAHRLIRHDPHPSTREGARLELLAVLLETYEKEHFKFRTPDPIEALEFRMEQQGLKQKDIAEIIGGKNRASEVLARKRPLTLWMIRALHEKLGIAIELLVQAPAAEYRVSRARGKKGKMQARRSHA
jgi:HTH-type transcriptional regulator / antitoxin HigA